MYASVDLIWAVNLNLAIVEDIKVGVSIWRFEDQMFDDMLYLGFLVLLFIVYHSRI